MFRNLKYLVLDVDGTMTDGGIYYDEHGNEMKKFCARDAAGIFAARQIGIKIVVITGRECQATKRRLEELQVDFIFQNVKDKKSFLYGFMMEKNIVKEEIGYIGDDLNDLEPMKLTGFTACPEDACREIIQNVNVVSFQKGGFGAVRDIIEQMMREEGLWEAAVSKVYGIGI